MQVLFIILNKIECLEEILEAFGEEHISGATVLESRGMAQVLCENDSDTPFMTSLCALFEPSHSENRTIMVVLEDEKIPVVSRIMNEITGGLENHDTGIMFAMPVTYTEGFKKKDEV